jgi:hypothetical protein
MKKLILSFLIATISILGIQKTSAALYETDSYYSTKVLKNTFLQYKKQNNSWVLTNRTIDTITWYNDPNYQTTTQAVVRTDWAEHYPYQSNPYYSKYVNTSFYCQKVNGNYILPPFKATVSTVISTPKSSTSVTYLGDVVLSMWEPYASTGDDCGIVNSKKTVTSDTNKEEYIINKFATVKVNLYTDPPFVGTVNLKWYGTRLTRTSSNPWVYTGTQNVLLSTFGPFSPNTIPTITLNLGQSNWDTCPEIFDITINADGTLAN